MKEQQFVSQKWIKLSLKKRKELFSLIHQRKLHNLKKIVLFLFIVFFFWIIFLSFFDNFSFFLGYSFDFFWKFRGLSGQLSFFEIDLFFSLSFFSLASLSFISIFYLFKGFIKMIVFLVFNCFKVCSESGLQFSRTGNILSK